MLERVFDEQTLGIIWFAIIIGLVAALILEELDEWF